jgi:hypothetical protein
LVRLQLRDIIMKLLVTTLAGVALIALAGCNRVAATNNAAGNAAANVSNAAAPAGNDAAGKPAGGGEAAPPADNATGAGGDKPADGGTATETSSDDQPPAEGEGGK